MTQAAVRINEASKRKLRQTHRVRCTAILPGSQTIESRSRCARDPPVPPRARAYVLFPEPELPKTRTFMPPNDQAQPRSAPKAPAGCRARLGLRS